MKPKFLRLTSRYWCISSHKFRLQDLGYNETVETELDAWPVGLRARYRALTVRMEEYGPNLGMPHTRALGNGLLEIRAKAEEGIGRVFFCTMVGRKIIILHSFIKKTDKTPKRELDVALTRQKEVVNNEL